LICTVQFALSHHKNVVKFQSILFVELTNCHGTDDHEYEPFAKLQPGTYI